MSAALKIAESVSVVPVALSLIVPDISTQPRADIQTATVDAYRADLEDGDTFPPIALFEEDGEYFIGDGFHRFLAYRAAGRIEIPACVHAGGKRAAMLHSVGANADHGLRRTNADKRRAVETMLADDEWRQWSDHEIARRCRVSNQFVANVRKEIQPRLSTVDSQAPNPNARLSTVDSRDPETGEISASETAKTPQIRKGADGRTINTEKIGRGKKAKEEPRSTVGKCRLNGELVDDPPDIAAARKAGRIHPDVVPDISEPEAGAPTAQDVVEQIRDEQARAEDISDEAWLATLPARAKLSPTRRPIFDKDALTYRALESHRKTFHHHASRLIRGDGTYAWRVRSFLKIEHPKDWAACVATEHGGCGGTGELVIGKCPKCHGRGYTIHP